MDDPSLPRPSGLPLTIGDIFRYLIPGTVAFVVPYLFERWCHEFKLIGETHTPLYTAFASTGKPDGWGYGLAFLLVGLGLAYVAGHLLAWISVVLLDRVLVDKGHGYPYEMLLRIRRFQRFAPRSASHSYRALFFWINLTVLAFVFWRLEGGAIADRFWLASFAVTSLLVVAKCVSVAVRWAPGLADSPLAPRRLRRARVKGRLLNLRRPSPSGRHWQRIKLRSRRLLTGLWAAFAAPYDLFTWSLGMYTRTSRPFSERFVRAYAFYFEEKFGMTPRQAETGNYWWTEMWIRENGKPGQVAELTYWHYLYSLSRNLSVAFYFSYIYCLSSLLLQPSVYDAAPMLVTVPLVALLSSLAFLARYYYLLVARHTRLMLRLFVFCSGGLRINRGANLVLPHEPEWST